MTRRDTVDGAVAEAARRFGRLDVLAHTVGHNLAGLAEEEPTDEQWARQYDFTLTGTVRCVRAALPKFAETGGGAVVLVGSMSGLVAFGTDPYAAAKAALGNLVRNLAARHGPDGVRVNMVVPGTVATRVWDDRPGALDELVSCIRCGGSGSRRTSPPPWRFSPPTTPRGSPASPCRSKAES